MTGKRIVTLILVSTFLFACRSKKNTTYVPLESRQDSMTKEKQVKEEILNQIVQGENRFTFYQANVKADYKEDSKGLGFDILLVMEKDKYIWMSITALLGIEVARVMITTDSVRILDRLHRKCISTDFSYLQQMSNVPFQLENLQNLIIGNTIFKNSEEKSLIDTLLGNIAVYTLLNSQKQSTFYNNQYRPQKSIITDQNQQKELKVDYNLFTQTDRMVLPSKIDINIRAEKRIDCVFELSNFVFEKKREVQFNVPSGYEIVKP